MDGSFSTGSWTRWTRAGGIVERRVLVAWIERWHVPRWRWCEIKEAARIEAERQAEEERRAAAREAGLDDAMIEGILREAETKEYGSGWGVLAQATAARLQRKSAAEAVARELKLSIAAIYASASGGVDPVDHIERVTAIWRRARGAGFNKGQLRDLYRGAENRQAGAGWTAIEDATEERVQRKSGAESGAANVFVDIDAVYVRARKETEDELTALEEETAKGTPVVAAARDAGFDDAAIEGILREAETKEYGSGWGVLAQATAARLQRKSAAEAVARELKLSIAAIYASASGGVDPVDHIERVTAIWRRARGAGFNKGQLRDLYRGAENRQAGAGWTAIEDATEERVQRKSGRGVGGPRTSSSTSTPCTCERGKETEDELTALEEETAKGTPVVAAARDAGFDDAAIEGILREAETKEYGSGWGVLAQATQDRNRRRTTAEESARGVARRHRCRVPARASRGQGRAGRPRGGDGEGLAGRSGGEGGGARRRVDWTHPRRGGVERARFGP